MDVPLLIEAAEVCFAFWLFRGTCNFKIIRNNSGQLKPEVREVFES